MTGRAGTDTLRARDMMLLAMLAGAALYIRLIGLWWDSGAMLHADERHILSVLGDILGRLRAPGADPWQTWFDPALSPLNPRRDGGFYVYGEGHLIVLALLAHGLGLEGWSEYLHLGRSLSGVLDATVVVAVFASVFLITRNTGPALLAAVFYAVLPIALQNAVFMTSDAWLGAASAWCATGLVFAVHAPDRRRFVRRMALAGVGAGLALAGKATGGLVALPILVALAISVRGRGAATLAGLLAVAVAALVSFRLASPLAFSGPAIWSLTPSPEMIADFAEMSSWAALPDYPPNWYWQAHYGPGPFLRDLAVFGFGPALVVALVTGAVMRPGGFVADATPILVAMGLAPILFCLSIDMPALRYLAPGWGAWAALAGIALHGRGLAVRAASVAVAIWWGSGMVRLHIGPHPRVVASAELARLPAGRIVANESAWDEALPARPWGRAIGPRGAELILVDLDLTAPDGAAKARHIAQTAGQADIVAVSSGRLRQSMPGLGDRFAMTRAWYEGLESGAFCYRRILEVDRGYPLPGLRLDDAWAQQEWRVFDHPIVRLYARQDCYSADQVEHDLLAAL